MFSHAGNEKALATVTAIIDGMGSIGAAIGPLMTGYISGAWCWSAWLFPCIGLLVGAAKPDGGPHLRLALL